MGFQFLSCLPFCSAIVILTVLVLCQVLQCSCHLDELYQSCATKFSCGAITEVGHPFRGNGDPEYCGYPNFLLKCNRDKTTTIRIMDVTYRVLKVNQTTQIMKIAREDVLYSTCPQDLANTTFNYALFDYTSAYMNISFLYGCPASVNLRSPTFLGCRSNEYDSVYVVPGAQGPGNCNVSVVVPVLRTGLEGSVNLKDLNQVLRDGFEVRWKVDGKECNDCTTSGGHCGYSFSTNQTTCFCPDKPYLTDSCSRANRAVPVPGGHSKSSPKTLPVVISVIGAILVGVAILWLFFVCRQRRKQRASNSVAHIASKDLSATTTTNALTTTSSTPFTKSIPSYPSSGSDVGKGSNYFGAQVFTYKELEEATDNFNPSKELGDGGFGTVYYGTLHDGRAVAVKRLYENNFKRVEQFMNEVKILTTLNHKNLVKLYGCTSKQSRDLLLVYEYIPNGTVADHVHGKQAKSGTLSWSVRLKIAIETAEALAYLHDSGIIHRDVKTVNILLDDSFCVKVADFGLSRRNPDNATHVSTAPQGTPGYVDPEYYKRYQLTDKSDVYSFGVVLVELISSLQAVDTSRHGHDINLANMAVRKIQNQTISELVDQSLGFDYNNSVKNMTTSVAELAFRCLQEEKDLRPTMKEVVEILREIQYEDFDTQKAGVLDIRVDDGTPLKGKFGSFSPDSVADKWISNSTSNYSE